jgi:deoxyribose-phosphate aldolase
MTDEEVAGRARIAASIDHTLLDPAATTAGIDRLCEEARRFGFATVCVNPVWVARCAKLLEGSGSGVCSVAGFPLGASLTEVKALEARRAVESGATEVDVMIALGSLKEGDHQRVRDDLAAVVAAAAPAGVKAILETGRLDDDEMRAAAGLALEAGARFVKTSTGFTGSGATPEAVRVLRAAVGARGGVKASGGIRSLEQALALIAAGASRLGTSAGVAIVGGRERDG